MKTFGLNIDQLPQFEGNLKNGKLKSGGRTEYIIKNLCDYVGLGQHILAQTEFSQVPLRFASFIKASKYDQNQEFHKDDTGDSLRALIYLTDVISPQHGAVEFESGPVLGSRGTVVCYKASTLHRGLANQTDNDRWILALAFSQTDQHIQTIGAVERVAPNEEIIFTRGVAVDFYEYTGSGVPDKDTSTWGNYLTTVEGVISLMSGGNEDSSNGDLIIPKNITNNSYTKIAMKATGLLFFQKPTAIIIQAQTNDGSAVDVDGISRTMTSLGEGTASWGVNSSGVDGTYQTESINLTAGFHEVTFWWYQSTGDFDMNFQFNISGGSGFSYDWRDILFTKNYKQPLSWHGDWDSSVTYHRNNIVTVGTQNYICLQNFVTDQDPSSSQDYWELFSQQESSSGADLTFLLIFILFIVTIFVIFFMLTTKYVPEPIRNYLKL